MSFYLLKNIHGIEENSCLDVTDALDWVILTYYSIYQTDNWTYITLIRQLMEIDLFSR